MAIQARGLGSCLKIMHCWQTLTFHNKADKSFLVIQGHPRHWHVQGQINLIRAFDQPVLDTLQAIEYGLQVIRNPCCPQRGLKPLIEPDSSSILVNMASYKARSSLLNSV